MVQLVPLRPEWRPLLSGPLRDRALDAARAIADDLADVPGPDAFDPDFAPGVAASLGSGAAGLAVTFSYLTAAGAAPGEAETAASFLDSAVATVATDAVPPDLCGGLAGVGWAASHLWYGTGDVFEDDRLSELDEEILSVLAREPWDGPFDLLYGLVGLGVYALERLPRKAARTALARVVRHLAALAERDGGLPTWRTGPHLLASVGDVNHPRGLYDLGVAHGIPGVLALLAQACAAGVAGDVARPLLEGGVEWLLGHASGGDLLFPSWIEPGGAPGRSTRSAWCYGDLGVAAILALAARCAGVPAWEGEAVAIALRSARRATEGSGVDDASFCHGAAGVAHLFNRLYQQTGRGELRGAAIAWLERTLAMRGDTGFGGYKFARFMPDLRALPDPALVDGSAGVALALAAASTSVEPSWDRFFLLSSAASR